MELTGRGVLVTGAARRVGRAIALRLARHGCRLAVHYHRSEDDARQTADDCRAAGATAELVQADLRDPAACDGLVREAVARLGRLDALINNASVFTPMTAASYALPAWEETIRVNLGAPMQLAMAARPELERHGGGRIVNLCDASLARPWPDHLAYVVSKGGLETLTRVLARALAPRINVVGVAPGVAAWPEDYDADTRARLTRRIPLGHAGTPEDIAAAVEFLLVHGDYITGVILPVDGGRHLA